jgi:hypothetical protein
MYFINTAHMALLDTNIVLLEELYHCQQAYTERTTGELGSISGGAEYFLGILTFWTLSKAHN